jgi:hypothetical protein
MNDRELREQDLEVATGMVEGAVRHVIAKRFDYGSMRWIRERAEPLLRLRCIEINGDWDAFVAFVQSTLRRRRKSEPREVRLLTTAQSPLASMSVAC